MSITSYVGEEAASQAKAFERKLQQLSPDAGVLFVGVQAESSENGKTKSFIVRMGVVRHVGRRAGESLVRYVMKEEIERGYRFLTNIHEGVSGAARDYDGDATTSSTPS